MSTRGIYGVRIDGQDKLTYNHADSYPMGLGADLVDQITKLILSYGAKWQTVLADCARTLKMVDESAIPDRAEREVLKRWHQNVDSGANWYALLRRSQGLLDKILTEIGFAVEYGGFVNESLSCEWGYVLNLDEGVFEVYKGFQHDNTGAGRYQQAAAAAGKPTDTGGFAPIALQIIFPIDENLPAAFTKWAADAMKDDEG